MVTYYSDEPRPYPNVIPLKNGRYEARLPGKPSKHLGTFDSPVHARVAVLSAQADRLEERAYQYRHEAGVLLGS